MSRFAVDHRDGAGDCDELLRAVLRAQGSAKRGEHRKAKRSPYPVTQIVAFYDGGSLPQAAEFQSMRCHDLSTGGIAFYWPSRPPAEHVVVGLGHAPSISYLTARITHFRPTDGPWPGYLIGCWFTGRVPTY